MTTIVNNTVDEITVTISETVEQYNVTVQQTGGIPAGGTTGQVLAKVSALNRDVEWVSPLGGGDLLSFNNLSDLTDAAIARTNLGLEIGVDVQAYSTILANTTASFTTVVESAIALNTAKVTNATHTGDVTGSVALTIQPSAISGKPLVTPASGDIVLFVRDGVLYSGDVVSFLSGGGGGVTNLGYIASPTQGTVTSDTGDNAVIPATDVTNAGLFLPAEKIKLDGIEAGAEVNVNADWDAISGDALILNKPILGTAAAANTVDFATAAQGALADSSLQSDDIGVSVQAYSSVLQNTTASFTTADETKLDGIEAGATVLGQKEGLASGLISGGELSINSGDFSKFDLSSGTGIIVDLYTTPLSPVVYQVSWGNFTAQTVTNLATSTVTHIFIDNSGNIVQRVNIPTEAERRQYILLGQLGHTNNTTIGGVIPTPDIAASPLSQLRDYADAVGIINIGNTISANGANLNLNKTPGYLYKLGSNFYNDNLSPTQLTIAAATAFTFRYRTQTGNGSTVSAIDPNNYDAGGTITAVPVNKVTNQRVFLTFNGNIVIQYGQVVYNSIALAITGIQADTANFIQFPNLTENFVLVGIITVVQGATDLSVSTQARFFKPSKFGESAAGIAGSSVSTFEQVYQNSTPTPELTTNAINGSVDFRCGSGADTDNVFTVRNTAGSVTFSVSGDGLVTSTNLTVTNPINGSITGNAGTVTNGVYTSGSYADPAWITSLNWSKITSRPTTLSGYGITDSVALTTGALSQFASTTSAQLAGVISDETGTGSVVFNTSPTFITPALGTPSSGTLTNCTGLPQSGVTNLTTDLANKQPLDGDLTAIAALSGTGILQKTAPDTWSFTSSLSDPTTTQGDLIYRNSGGALTRLAIGTNNKVLVSNGTIPVYANPLIPQARTLLRQALGSPILTQTLQYEDTATVSNVSSQRAQYGAFYNPFPVTATGGWFYLATAGVFTGNNNNYIKLYSYSAGTLTEVAASVNNENIWKTSGFVQVAFTTPVVIARGAYYLGLLYCNSAQTTAPQLRICNVTIPSFGETNNASFFLQRNSQTSLPASESMANLTAGSIQFVGGVY